MPRPATKGFQKPIDNGKRREVRVATITEGENYAKCSCNAVFTQARKKVRDRAVDKHVDSKHGGRAIFL